MSISVTTGKVVAGHIEFGTFYGFVKFGFALITRISNENSARRALSSSTCLTRLLKFKQPILKPRLDGKKLDILEGPELPGRTSLSTDSGIVCETRE